MLTCCSYVEQVVAEAINKHGKSIGRSKPVWTVPPAGEGDDTSIDGSPYSAATASDLQSSEYSDPDTEWSAEDLKDESTQQTEATPSNISTWADFLYDRHFIAVASGLLSGTVACAALIAVIWALKRLRGADRWSSTSAKYAPLHDDQRHAEDDDELEKQVED